MARYEPIRTGDGHHHHLVCDNCGTVTPFTDPDLETAIKKLEPPRPDARRRTRNRAPRRLPRLQRLTLAGSPARR